MLRQVPDVFGIDAMLSAQGRHTTSGPEIDGGPPSGRWFSQYFLYEGR
ncbi:hypothetical protein [Methanogenium sp. MK-MG]|nr:hypothetical protein [Methanogenium sp. MK-MG]